MEGKQSKIDLKPSLKSIDIAGGKVYRNPFLNFLQDFRKSHRAKLDVVEITRRAAQLWRIMNERERSPYINMSRNAPKRRQFARKVRTKKAKSESVLKKQNKGDSINICKYTGQKNIKHPLRSPRPSKRKLRSKKSLRAVNSKLNRRNPKALPKRRKCVCGRFVKFV